MMKYPLFGQDSVPHYTSNFFAILGTVFFWIIFFVVSIFVKPVEKKPKYKTVQIVLSEKKVESQKDMEKSATENLEMAEEIPVTKTTVPPVVQESSVVEEPVKKTKIEKKEVSKKSDSLSVKKSEATIPAPEPVYAKSVEELMEEQWNSKKSEKSESVWDSFEEDIDVIKTPQTTSQKVAPIENSFSGNAGTTEAAQKIKSETVAAKEPVQAAQKSTNSALNEIENARASAISDVSNESTNNSAKENHNSDFIWKNGEVRKLIMPSHPEIIISKENQNKINFSEVEISFTVSADGYVLKNSVITNPTIPQSVLNEIAEQILEWWFAPGSESATAIFRLSIKQKY